MDELPVSEILPGLYRAVLDAVPNLEARGRRAEAATIRAEGTRVYSRAWTPDAAGRRRALCTKAARIGDGRPRNRDEAVVATLGRPAVQAVDLERRTA